MKNTSYKICLLIAVLTLLCSCNIEENNITPSKPTAAVSVDKTSGAAIENSNESLSNGPLLEELKKSDWDYQTFKKVIGAPNYNLADFDVYYNQGFKVNTGLGDAEIYNYFVELKDKNFKKVNSKIVNVVFNSKYKDNIVGNITVNSQKIDIINSLGKPDFENSYSNVFGYKLDEVYIFFNGKEKVEEISIYKRDVDNKDILEKVLANEINDVEISPEIISSWGLPDKYRSDHGGFSWSYLSRGIMLKGDNNCSSKDADITLYGNYEGDVKEDERVELKSDNNLVFEEEQLRLQNEKQYGEKLSKGKLSTDKSKVLFSDVLSENFDSMDKNLYIVWKNAEDAWQLNGTDQNPVYGYKWLDNTHFVMATRSGISLGDAAKKELYETLSVGELSDYDKEICAFDEKTNIITLYSKNQNSREKKIVLEFGKNNELLNKEQIIKELKSSK